MTPINPKTAKAYFTRAVDIVAAQRRCSRAAAIIHLAHTAEGKSLQAMAVREANHGRKRK